MKTATLVKTNCFLFLILFSSLTYSSPIRGDGHLSLYYDARKESLDITFRDKNGQLIPTAVDKIITFLRSPDNQTHAINIDLIDLVDAIQDHFHEPVIEVISGYRSPNYNRTLKETGHAVANESLHMQGMAMDIHLDTTTEEAVRDYALSLHQGGVGWYPQNDFVHVDVGPVRTWGHAETTRKFVGLNNNTGPLTLRSNDNRYFRNDKINISVSPSPKSFPWELERFDRGAWKLEYSSGRKSLFHADFQIPTLVTKKLPRGRYRIRIQDSLSNEFYLKK